MAYLNQAAGRLREGGQGDAVADLGALTAAAAAGATPTKAEFDAAVADLGTIRTKMNALLAELRQAGVVASS